MKSDTMTIYLKVWRQPGPDAKGQFVTYTAKDVSPDMSFLELLDVLNEQLIKEGQDPIEFDHDCREGICGSCSMVLNGLPHGPEKATAACQLHMRSYKDGAAIVVEPFRARAFPVIRDLVVDRTAFDRIISAGGYVTVKTGSAPDGNAIPIPRDDAEAAMDYAACIGCGACVAACPNSSASLFTGAKIAQLALLPQGRAEAARRVTRMVDAMEDEGFGNCSNHAECEAACPKEISVDAIASMRREYLKAMTKG